MEKHAYVELPMSEVDRLVHGGMFCQVCGLTRKDAVHWMLIPVKTEKGEKREELRATLLSLKAYQEEIEMKARVCYAEICQVIAEMDEEESGE